MTFSSLTGHLSGKLLIVAGVCTGLLAASAPASADTFNVQYFQVTTAAANSPSQPTNSDFFPGGVNTGTVSNDFVTNTLDSATGMPVFNSLETGAAAANDLGTGNVLEWWTPGTYNGNTVASTGSGTLNLSSTPINMFPPNSTGGGDTGLNCDAGTQNCEETAILTGTFTLASAGTVPFTVSADDDAFVFVDGQLIEDLGGIHQVTSGPDVSPVFSAGTHTVEIFYADQDQVAAQLAFTDGGDTVGPTPEPGSLALLGTGVLGLAGTLRRRMMKS